MTPSSLGDVLLHWEANSYLSVQGQRVSQGNGNKKLHGATVLMEYTASHARKQFSSEYTVLKNCSVRSDTAVGIRRADHVDSSLSKKLAITSPTSGCRSAGIVRSRTQTMEFSLVFMLRYNAVMQLAEALCYKPEGRGFDSR
jgi:hypothetical protein